jgi:hypothetical protein
MRDDKSRGVAREYYCIQSRDVHDVSDFHKLFVFFFEPLLSDGFVNTSHHLPCPFDKAHS